MEPLQDEGMISHQNTKYAMQPFALQIFDTKSCDLFGGRDGDQYWQLEQKQTDNTGQSEPKDTAWQAVASEFEYRG